LAKILAVGSVDKNNPDTPGKAVLEKVMKQLMDRKENDTDEDKSQATKSPEHRSDDEAETEDEKNKPLFEIDVNIDGVQPFKNSKLPKVTPILGRIVSINGIWIPMRDSKPFVIAIAHGVKSPPQDEFLEQFFDELERLEPAGSNRTSQNGERPSLINLKLRCFICDTPERSHLKGMETYGNAMKKSR